jgi:hypothetical protein
MDERSRVRGDTASGGVSKVATLETGSDRKRFSHDRVGGRSEKNRRGAELARRAEAPRAAELTLAKLAPSDRPGI